MTQRILTFQLLFLPNKKIWNIFLKIFLVFPAWFCSFRKKGGGNFTNSVLLYTFFPIYLNIMAAGNKWKVFSSRTRSNIFICPLTGVCPRFDRKWKVVKNTLLRWFLLYVMYKNYPHVMLPLINFSMLEFKARK